MKSYNIADLRHRLELEAPELTPDTGGGASITWIKEADVWGLIEPLRGQEQFKEHQTETIVTHTIIIRHREGLLPEKRLRKGQRLFEIIAVINEKERNHWLKLECKEQET